MRQTTLTALQEHRKSWVKLGEKLAEIQEKELYKEWGYENFSKYIKDELDLSTVSATQMISAYQYIRTHRPALLQDQTSQYVPDYNSIACISKNHDKLGEKADEIENKLFQSHKDRKEAIQEIASHTGPSGEEIMDQIKNETTKVIRTVSKVNHAIHNTSSFGEKTRIVADELLELVKSAAM